jgi:hypothetical protein
MPDRVYGCVRPEFAPLPDPEHFAYSRITQAKPPLAVMPEVRWFLAVVAIALVASAFGAGGAAARPACWKTLLTDEWDGRIDGIYPVRCYEQALKHLPEDVLVYGQAKNDLERALLTAVAVNGNHPLGAAVLVPADSKAPAQPRPRKGVLQRLLAGLGPTSPTAAPLPLLVLAGIAVLLMAAAGASVAARWAYARRRRRSSSSDRD